MNHHATRRKDYSPPWMMRLRRRQIALWAERLSRSGRYFAPLFANLVWNGTPALAGLGGTGEPKRDPAEHNLSLLAKGLGLSEIETEIIRFLAIKNYDRDFCTTFKIASAAKRHGLATVIACALERTEEEVRHSLSLDGALCRIGVIQTGGSLQGPGDHYVSALPIGNPLDVPATSFLDLALQIAPPAQAMCSDFSTRVNRAAERLAPRFASREPGAQALLVGSRLHTCNVGHALAIHLDAQLLDFDRFSRPGWLATWYAIKYRLVQTALPGCGQYLLHMNSAPCLLHPSAKHMVQGISDPPWQHLFLAQARIPTLWLVPDIADVDPAVLPFFAEIVEV